MKYKGTYHGREESTGDLKKRLKILVVFVLVFFAALSLRLWHLQVVQGGYYRQLSESNRIRTVNIRPPRGILYDRNGVALAINVPSYTITLTPGDAKNSPDVSQRLAGILGMTMEEFEDRLRREGTGSPYQPVRMKENASFAEVSKVEAHADDLPGVMVQVELRRHYPNGEFASHLFGYIGKITPAQSKLKKYDGLPPDFLVGQYGVEKEFDTIIRGQPGKRGIEVDARGRQLREIYTIDPVPGDDLVLTIDYDAQKAAEDALEGKEGAIVAIRPSTGEVLAMTSRPGFDPNIFTMGLTSKQWQYLTQDSSHPLNNRALQGQFPPGSTFKLAMALAGLETGKAGGGFSVFCTGGWHFGNRTFRCWKREGHGHVGLHKAVVESCDVFFYKLGDAMGIDNIAKYSGFLGLGEETGIGIRESSGLIPSTSWKKKARGQPWYPGETLSCAIGQGYVSVTPIQLARMVATIANGGMLYKPQVVRSIKFIDDRKPTAFLTIPVNQAPVDKKNLDYIMDAMRGVVEEPGGTARIVRSEYVSIGGKTGTAQVVGLGKGKGKKYQDHAWFVAVAPVEDPEIAVCVLVEHGGHGGSAAAPLARKVIDAYLGMDEIDAAKAEMAAAQAAQDGEEISD